MAHAPEITRARRDSVLVIDHDPGVRRFLGEALAREDFDVTLAEGAEPVLAAAEDRELRAIVLDTDASRISGPDLLAFLRHRWPGVPVIVTTRWGSPAAGATARRWGGSAYVSDPAHVVALAVRLRERARRRP